MRKIFCVLLIVASLLSLSACSGRSADILLTESSASTSPRAVKASGNKDIYANGGGVFSKEFILLPDEDASIVDTAYSEGVVYMLGTLRGDGQHVYTMNQDGAIDRRLLPEEVSAYRISAHGGSLCVLGMDEQGGIVLLTSVQGGNWTAMPLPEQDEYTQTVVADISIVDSGYVIFTADRIFALDAQGRRVKDLGNYYRYGSCFPAEDGGFVLVIEALQAGTESPITKTLVFDGSLNLADSFSSAKQFTAFFDLSGERGTIICQKLGTLFEFDYEKDAATPIINLELSGISTASLICLDDNIYFSIIRGAPYILKEASGGGTAALTLAAYHLDQSLKDYISSYNESGAQYAVNIVDYAMYDEAGNEGQGLLRLQADIISGKTPDLYDLSCLPAKIYAEHGIFEDLKPYLSDGTGGIYDKLVPSAIKALEYKGGLYYIAPSFKAVTICGSETFVGDKGKWTNEDFFNAVKDIPPVQVFGPEVTKAAFLSCLLQFQGAEYIDYDSGRCSFASSDFERFLEFAHELPDECDYEALDSQPSGRAFMGMQQLLTYSVGSGAVGLLSFADTIFGGRAQCVGFPANSNGVALSPTSLVGVSASSTCKNGALDFIKYLLSDPLQKTVPDCPLVMARLDERMEKWEAQYLEYPAQLYTFYGGIEVTIQGETDLGQVKARLAEIINRIDCTTIIDEEVLNILIRESQAYFAGSISAAEAAANIQSRVSIYLAEQYG